MPDIIREHKTIESFCERLSLLTDFTTKVVDWPDEKNPGKGCCDVLIVRKSEQIAVDHRVVESFTNHYRDNALFNSIVVPLENSLNEVYPQHRIRINIRVRSIPKGYRDKMREILKEGCLKALHSTPNDCRMHKYHVADLPCDIWISKTPSKQPGCFVGRRLPKDQEVELNEGMLQALKSKSKQLERYKIKSFQTLLLLDSDDYASLDEYMIANAFSLATKHCDISAIDEVYLFYSYTDSFIILPLKISRRTYPNLEEFNSFYQRQYEMI